MKYYAIKGENKKEIVTSWQEAQDVIKNTIKPKFKSFKSKEEAEAFLNDEIFINKVDGPCAYIDGSYNDKTKEYSFASILLIDGNEYRFSKKYDEDEYSIYRNVAGEVKGAGFIIQYAINHKIKVLHIYYDYQGIEMWYNNIWKANSSIAIKYVEFANMAKEKINVIFHKVESHTNDYYNDLVDKLAKEALGL